MTSHHFYIETSGIARAAAHRALANTFAKFRAPGKLRTDTGAATSGLLPTPIHEPNEARA